MRFAFLGCQVRFIVKAAFLGFTADQTAGAGTMAPAATPVTDFRKSRRYM